MGGLSSIGATTAATASNSDVATWFIVLGFLALIAWGLSRSKGDTANTRSLAISAPPAAAANRPSIQAGPRAVSAPVGRIRTAEEEERERFMSLYSLRTRFFSRTEGAFYRALLRAVSPRYFVFAKVRLLDICNQIPGGDYSAMNRIAKKHVDFLLCDPVTFAPVAAIEVDGSSHERADRIERDAFVNALFVRIGLPLIRVPAASWFEPADVLQRIELATSLN